MRVDVDMTTNDPIKLKLPRKGFTIKDVKQAMDDEFVRKVHEALTSGTDHVVIRQQDEGEGGEPVE
jgi:hypothetical protein